MGRIARHLKYRVKRAMPHLPASVQRRFVQRQHLRIVTTNFPELTDRAYLGDPPEDFVNWITPAKMPALPNAGFDWRVPTHDDLVEMRRWIDAGPYDTDDLLNARTDNHDDELGRVIAALRLRIALAEAPATPFAAHGDRVLVDARSLQTAAFGARGIGRFAKSALAGVREAIGDDRVVLLVDHGLERLPESLAGACEQITRVTEQSVVRFSVFVQPSPMTATNEPLLPILHSDAHKIAIVFDFIPMHYPTIYLWPAGNRSEYAAALDSLRFFDEFVAISHLAADELAGFLARTDLDVSVAWPAEIGLPATPTPGSAEGPIVIMTGDEPRKNTYGALAAIGAATAGSGRPRDVVVIGMAGHETRVHHWSIHAAMHPGEARTVGRISDDEMFGLLRDSSLVVVLSFDEGLSLPVIEALSCGATVVASDIPAHRELIGTGAFMADPTDMADMTATIRANLGSRKAFDRQFSHLAAHRHEALEEVLARTVSRHVSSAPVALPPARVHSEGRDYRLGIATPWTPQRSGVADFSDTVTVELARMCDVTVYTTRDTVVQPGIRHASVNEVLAHGSDHDGFISVIGNSHFHIPFISLLSKVDAVAVAHDTRMVEYYMAMRARNGAEQVMLRGTGERQLRLPLDEQIDDMRLLQNTGFWEIANRAKALVLHSPSAAPRIAAETGVTPYVLPFATQRYPLTDEVTQAMRDDARARLGFSDNVIHIASFGHVDVRTKMVDVVVEAAAWLCQWGHRVSLHLAGSGRPEETEPLIARAREAGITEFEITGYLSDNQFRDYLLAVDIGLQLRVSPLLGVSGPLSDLSAYGTTSIASSGLAIDVDTPDYVDRLPDEVSPLLVAEALEYRIANPIPAAAKEPERHAYLARKSPRAYAESLLSIMREVG